MTHLQLHLPENKENKVVKKLTQMSDINMVLL